MWASVVFVVFRISWMYRVPLRYYPTAVQIVEVRYDAPLPRVNYCQKTPSIWLSCRLVVVAPSCLASTLVWSEEFDSLDQGTWKHVVSTFPQVGKEGKEWAVESDCRL